MMSNVDNFGPMQGEATSHMQDLRRSRKMAINLQRIGKSINDGSADYPTHASAESFEVVHRSKDRLDKSENRVGTDYQTLAEWNRAKKSVAIKKNIPLSSVSRDS
jgi:hypothetical protein